MVVGIFILYEVVIPFGELEYCNDGQKVWELVMLDIGFLNLLEPC